MTTPKGGRPVLDGNDWLRSVEKRVGHEERRPRVTSAKDLLGPGFDAHAVQLLDWNSETARFNGMWFSENALNAPTPTGQYLGFSVAAASGHIVQFAMSHTTAGLVYLRTIHRHEAAAPTYTAWTALTGSGTVISDPTAAIQAAITAERVVTAATVTTTVNTAIGASTATTAANLSTGLRTTDAVLVWDGTGTQPLRSTITTDTLRPVRWRQPTAPPTTTGYAITGLDVWEQTP